MRSSSRALLGLGGALCCGAAALAFPVDASLVVDRVALFADGRSTARVRAAPRTVLGTRAWFSASARVVVAEEEARALGVTLWPAHDGSLVLRAGTRPGELAVRLEGDGGAELERARIALRADPADLDEDGLPDVAELLTEEDRAAFTAWFTAIAEAQHVAVDDRWAKVHQDCAGLVRFAFREALKPHDRAWLLRWRFLPSVSAPDVASLRYPELPLVGELPFRKSAGAFDAEAPLEAQLTAAPAARALWQLNSVFLSRDLEDARAGDLLFFRAPEDTGSRMHTMIVLGERPGATHHERGTRVVYHTGLDGEAGEVRLVSLAALLQHPDAGWRPLPSNPRFLGVHRLIHLVHERKARDHLALRPLPVAGGRP